jgi:hypothetical protein
MLNPFAVVLKMPTPVESAAVPRPAIDQYLRYWWGWHDPAFRISDPKLLTDAERATLAVSGMRLNKSLALIALASLTICSAKAQLEAGERIVTEAEALNALGLPAPNLYVSPESNFVATNQSEHRKRLQP